VAISTIKFAQSGWTDDQPPLAIEQY